ncbi:MAG: polysaccharide deacetylase family protein [Verrucomicrobiales bacterium]
MSENLAGRDNSWCGIFGLLTVATKHLLFGSQAKGRRRWQASCKAAFALSIGLTACQPRPAQQTPAPTEPGPALASDEPAPLPAEAPAEAPLNAQAPELKIKKSAQVAILGYHDFTTGRSNSPMVINVQKFRQHLQSIKDARLSVISMDHYLAWRRGEQDIPDPAVLITIDDGWKSVHSIALPVLQEFGYPFTIFLYKNFVNGGGRALSTGEIKDLMSKGAAVGSHSVSHPFPAEFKKRAKGPPEDYEAWIEREFKESREFLEQLLGIQVRAFAYPGGYYTHEMAQKGREVWGYEALFTCNPVRTSWDTPAAEIGRFIIYGNDPNDRNFRSATNFHGGAEELGRQLLGGEIGDDGNPQAPLVVVKPGENETVTERRPFIEVDLSKLPDVDPASVSMRMAGFGLVPATFDQESGKLVYRPVQILRSPEVTIHVRLRRKGEDKDDMVSWKFFIDLNAHYLSPEVAGPEATPASGGEKTGGAKNNKQAPPAETSTSTPIDPLQSR